MSSEKREMLIPEDVIASKIYFIRGKKIMLDRDLAQLYGVSTGQLNQQVKRNKLRFPEDFMFQLDQKELQDWISQIVISKSNKGIRRNAALEAGNPKIFLIALRDVAEAQGNMAAFAEQYQLHRTSLYKITSKHGNPSLIAS